MRSPTSAKPNIWKPYQQNYFKIVVSINSQNENNQIQNYKKYTSLASLHWQYSEVEQLKKEEKDAIPKQNQNEKHMVVPTQHWYTEMRFKYFFCRKYTPKANKLTHLSIDR